MDRYTPRHGSGLMAWEHIAWMQDATQKTLANAFADYLSTTDSFYVDGAVVSSTPSGTGTIYAITDGVVCLAGEFMPLVGGSVLKSASQVVFLVIQDTGVDVYPDANLDGQSDHVMRERKAVMQVGVAYPAGSFSLDLARKTELDMLRLKGRVVPMGGILPYFGTMVHFDATGLGLAGTSAEGWAVCNGMNGTIDMRGMVPMGATNVPSSGAGGLYGGVAPGVTNAGDAVGQDGVTLDANQLPAHTHPYIDSVVSYDMGGPVGAGGSGLRHGDAKVTSANTTAHDSVPVRQSSRALVFIQSVI